MNYYKQQYVNKCYKTKAEKQLKEEEICSLEKLEMELMQKLSKTQSIQQKAFEELQTALVLPSKEFSQKFNIGKKKKRKKKKKFDYSSYLENSAYTPSVQSRASRKSKKRKKKQHDIPMEEGANQNEELLNKEEFDKEISQKKAELNKEQQELGVQ